jgi:hypothetical protein
MTDKNRKEENGKRKTEKRKLEKSSKDVTRRRGSQPRKKSS